MCIRDRPFAVEHIALPFIIADQKMKETDFLGELTQKTGCKVILDLNNLYTNEENFSIDSREWLQELPIDAVEGIHLAGGFVDDLGIQQDGHCKRVPEAVWELYKYALSLMKKNVPTIIERTGNNEKEGLKPILADMKRAFDISETIFIKKRSNEH